MPTSCPPATSDGNSQPGASEQKPVQQSPFIGTKTRNLLGDKQEMPKSLITTLVDLVNTGDVAIREKLESEVVTQSTKYILRKS